MYTFLNIDFDLIIIIIIIIIIIHELILRILMQ